MLGRRYFVVLEPLDRLLVVVLLLDFQDFSIDFRTVLCSFSVGIGGGVRGLVIDGEIGSGEPPDGLGGDDRDGCCE
jgi:hypothetical protein